MVNFVREYIKLIVNNPDVVKVYEKDIDDSSKSIEIYLDYADMGKAIGKEGNMLKSLSTFLSASKAKERPNYKLAVKNIDEL